MALALLLLLLPAQAQSADRYEQRFAEATRLEQSGDMDGAVERLETLLPDYPQDFALRLQLGWLCFRLERYPDAAEHYRHARSLSPESDDAANGLAWSLLRQGERSAAREIFLEVLARSPDSATAPDGELLSRVQHRLSAGIGAIVHRYGGHGSRDSAVGSVLWGQGVLWDALLLGGAWRYTRFSARYEAANGAWSDTVETEYAQHEGSIYVGYAGERFGATLHYGYADGAGEDAFAVHYAGAMGRLTTWGTLRLEASGSRYDAFGAWRVAADYALPVADGLTLRPGAAWQNVDGENLGNASLGLESNLGALRLSLGGRYGLEKMPLYLAQAVVYNSDDAIRYGAWAGVGYRFDSGIDLSGGYELQRLESEGDSGTEYSNLHLFTLSLGFATTLDD